MPECCQLSQEVEPGHTDGVRHNLVGCVTVIQCEQNEINPCKKGGWGDGKHLDVSGLNLGELLEIPMSRLHPRPIINLGVDGTWPKEPSDSVVQFRMGIAGLVQK